MVTTKDRVELREELVAQGYSWEYVDGWQPKITLYRHTRKLNPTGDVVDDVGSKVANLPGNPDYVLKKAKLGMFPYPPSDTCECRWCSVRQVNDVPATEPEEEPSQESVICQTCGESVSALTKAGALSRLRVHIKAHPATEETE